MITNNNYIQHKLLLKEFNVRLQAAVKELVIKYIKK